MNRAALAKNTTLAAQESVYVGVAGSDPDRPWFLQERFRIMPLDAGTPVAASLSRMGEIVFSEHAWDFVRRPHLQPRIGEAVVLKNASKRLDENPEWLHDLLRTSIRRPAL